MKKTMTLLLFAAAIALTGCDWIKNLGEVDFSTDLTVNVPVTVSSGSKTALNYSASNDLMLADNEDVEPYLDKLRKIDLKSVVITITGLVPGQTINTLSLDVTGVGTLFTQNNITSTSNSFTPTVDAAKLNQAGEKLKNDREITLTVSGTASGPMAFNAAVLFDATVTAGALD